MLSGDPFIDLASGFCWISDRTAAATVKSNLMIPNK
jgi:hypothetical protein